MPNEAASPSLQRSQKIQQVLFLIVVQLSVETNHSTGVGPVAVMQFDCLHQIAGAAVVQEKDALTQAPQRSASKLIPVSESLRYAIVKCASHFVGRQIGI